jgi:alkylation response protein AidB-like acyl-CoA dehydrogenase
MTYAAPLRDMRFVLKDLVGLDRIAALPGCDQVTPELVDAILDEAARFAADVLAPLNQTGDRVGCRLEDGRVTTPPGFADAYASFIAGGWTSLAADPVFGGQGLPSVIAAPVDEMVHASNMSFGLCPLLTRGAIEALHLCGTEEQKRLYLPRMVEGTWTGTMNLTEPQAGSDLSAVRTRAVPAGDGTYRITGTKIFITYGEHDWTDNIIHLVLARLPDAPEGVKGISLFVVPKFLVDEDGNIGARNHVVCTGIEHKLGIHASPTASLAYEGAVGTLVGEPNRGLEYMFVMMNLARFAVGLEGVAVADRATQAALAYARDRVQGTEIGVRGGERIAIIRHPDVRRMLMSMRAQTEAMRALAYVTAAALDTAARHDDEEVRAAAQAEADLLIPVVKGWSTETVIEVASTGIQVHGGMGFIEETGAAQYLRDARITTIYEGTTGIQANDLIGRKIARDGAAAAGRVIASIRATAEVLSKTPDPTCHAVAPALAEAATALERAVAWVVEMHRADPRVTSAGAVPLLRLFGIVAGGWQMGRAAVIAAGRLGQGDNADREFYLAKLNSARFYADHVLSQASGLAHAATSGAIGTLGLDDAAQFAA